MLLFALLVPGASTAQETAPAEQQAEQPSAEQQPQQPGFAGQRTLEIARWVEALGSREFAKRERAADALISIGIEAVPLLEKAHRETVDPEVKIRTRLLIHQLRSGSLEAKIESFLAGEDVDFENWGIIKSIFGDLPKSRDLYVELLQTYPGLVSALDGTSRELVVAMDGVTDKITSNRTKLGWQPRVSDAIALMLPATDEAVPVSVSYEDLMLSMMRLSPINRLPKDKVLGPPFQRLAGTWMGRSQPGNRQDILYFALEWNYEQAFALAKKTLIDTTDAETLAHAMQAIAKHGNKTDTAYLLPFLDDRRLASQPRIVRQQSIETQLGDVAMATIAILNGVNMKDIGHDESVKHETYGFIYDEVGFPKGDQELRAKARKKIDEVIARRLNELEQQGS